MKTHYFDGIIDEDDFFLQMAIGQGYVPKTCLLGGEVIMSLINSGQNPCTGCNGPREKCKSCVLESS